MAKKSIGSDAADAVKTVAGAALGAAAAAATGVILHSVAGAFGSGEKKLEQATPSVQNQVGAKVASKIAAPKRPGKKATGKKKAARKAKAAVKKRPAAKSTRSGHDHHSSLPCCRARLAVHVPGAARGDVRRPRGYGRGLSARQRA